MQQKICLISFDHWNYDIHIVNNLKSRGIDAHHIKIGDFKHANLFARISNTLQKIFLNKNPKKKKRQDFIISSLKKRGLQDQILVINPELIDKEYHLKIKTFTKKYMAYLYDSVERCNVTHLLDGIFDEIYSFDKKDIETYHFKETSNYNYILKTPNFAIKNDVLYIGSIDNRIHQLNKIGNRLKEINVNYKFIIIGKKYWIYKISNFFTKKHEHLVFKRNRINQQKLLSLYSETKVIIDLVRENQTGLSFRFFEAMALEKKMITNNNNVINYSFFETENILILKDNYSIITHSFIRSPYKTLKKEVFNKYTLDTWCNKVFQLKT